MISQFINDKKTLQIIDDTLKEIKALDTKNLNPKLILLQIFCLLQAAHPRAYVCNVDKLIRALKKNKVEIINLEGRILQIGFIRSWRYCYKRNVNFS